MVLKTFLAPKLLVWQSVRQRMPLDRGAIPVLQVGTIVEALRQHLSDEHSSDNAGIPMAIPALS